MSTDAVENIATFLADAVEGGLKGSAKAWARENRQRLLSGPYRRTAAVILKRRPHLGERFSGTSAKPLENGNAPIVLPYDPPVIGRLAPLMVEFIRATFPTVPAGSKHDVGYLPLPATLAEIKAVPDWRAVAEAEYGGKEDDWGLEPKRLVEGPSGAVPARSNPTPKWWAKGRSLPQDTFRAFMETLDPAVRADIDEHYPNRVFQAFVRAMWQRFVPEGWLPKPRAGRGYSADEISRMGSYIDDTYGPGMELYAQAIELDRAYGLDTVGYGTGYKDGKVGAALLKEWLGGGSGAASTSTFEAWVRDTLRYTDDVFPHTADGSVRSVQEVYGERVEGSWRKHRPRLIHPQAVRAMVLSRYINRIHYAATKLDLLVSLDPLWRVVSLGRTRLGSGKLVDIEWTDRPRAQKAWMLLQKLPYGDSQNFDLRYMHRVYGLAFEDYRSERAREINKALRARLNTEGVEAVLRDQQAKELADIASAADAKRKRIALVREVLPAARDLLAIDRPLTLSDLNRKLPKGFVASRDSYGGVSIDFPDDRYGRLYGSGSRKTADQAYRGVLEQAVKEVAAFDREAGVPELDVELPPSAEDLEALEEEPRTPDEYERFARGALVLADALAAERPTKVRDLRALVGRPALGAYAFDVKVKPDAGKYQHKLEVWIGGKYVLRSGVGAASTREAIEDLEKKAREAFSTWREARRAARLL